MILESTDQIPVIMEKLYTLSLSAVSSNIEQISCNNDHIKYVMYLPPFVLQDLLPYLCPRSLMGLHEFLENMGINVNNIWEYHYRQRWPYKHQREPNILDLFQMNWHKDFYKRYLRKHFHSILRTGSTDNISENALGKGLNNMFTSMENHKKGKTAKINLVTHSKAVQDLLNLQTFLPHVSYLSISASQCLKLLDESVLTFLRRSVSRLDVHTLKNENLKRLKDLLESLLHFGCLKELHIFNCAALDIELFYSLLHLCAGHSKSGSNLGHAKVSENQTLANFVCDGEQQISCSSDDLFSNNSDFELDTTDESDIDECSPCLFDDALQIVNPATISEVSKLCNDEKVPHKREFFSSENIATPDCICHNGVTSVPYHGLKGFSVISPGMVDPWVAELYQGVLPYWQSLRALCLSRVDLQEKTFADTIAQCTGKPWNLKEIVLDECSVSCECLFHLMRKIISHQTRKEPMHRLKLSCAHVTGIYDNPFEEIKLKTFQAFQTLELINVTVNCPKAQRFLFSLVSCDTALHNLTLATVTPETQLLHDFLVSFNGQNLCSFQLHSIKHEEINLHPVLQTMANVQSLSLCNFTLNETFFVSDAFISCLTSMKKLQHFSVSYCRIGDNVAKLLEKLLTKPREALPALRSVDISHTACSEKALEKAAANIIQEDCKTFGTAVKHLEVLKFSHFKTPIFSEATQWRQLVKKLEVSMEYMPYADYVSMM